MPVVRFEDGILVEVAQLPGQTFPMTGSQGIPEAKGKLEQSLAQLQQVLKKLSHSADDVILEGKAMEVEFLLGIKFTAEGSILVSTVTGETSVQVKVKFKRDATSMSEEE